MDAVAIAVARLIPTVLGLLVCLMGLALLVSDWLA
jgi:hypothetical protein